jgi:hypothetical protein
MENQFLTLLPSLIYMMSNQNGFQWFMVIPLMFPMILPYLSKLNWTCPSIRSSKLEYTARMKMEEWSEHPTAVVSCFSNIVWEWIRLNQVVNLPKMMEDVQHQRNYYSHEGIKRVIPFFIDDSSKFFYRTGNPYVRYCMWVDREVDKDGFEHPSIFLKIQFDSKDPKDIVDHVEWIKQESERICQARHVKQQVLVSIESINENESSRDSTPSVSFMVHEFFTTSSFDNFFSEEAASVRMELDVFLKDKTMYERIGRPWNYSILNTGAPGVGKTKLVKAIAAFTGRTLIVLNLQHITSPLLLHQVFHSSILSGIHIPHDKRLYYIPEVDTQLLEVAKKREKKADPVLVPAAGEKQKEPELKPSITLGDILNVLDGIPERTGHILVLDTNRLEELDPALIRPGRIDRLIEWKKSSAACSRQMLEHFYGEKIPSSVKLPNQKYTPAELQSIFYQSSTWKEAVRQL